MTVVFMPPQDPSQIWLGHTMRYKGSGIRRQKKSWQSWLCHWPAVRLLQKHKNALNCGFPVSTVDGEDKHAEAPGLPPAARPCTIPSAPQGPRWASGDQGARPGDASHGAEHPPWAGLVLPSAVQMAKLLPETETAALVLQHKSSKHCIINRIS